MGLDKSVLDEVCKGRDATLPIALVLSYLCPHFTGMMIIATE
jgi:hypothetical protein